MFIFYHEFDSTSMGASTMIINLVRGLTAAGEKVLLFNFIGGALQKSLADIPDELLEVTGHDQETLKRYADRISSSDVIITMHYYTAYRVFKKANPKLIFYCVNITSIPVANRYFKKIHLRSLTRKLVQETLERKGFLFIDHYSLHETRQQLDLEIPNPDFLPIPVEVPDEMPSPLRAHSGKKLVLTYVGRAADWKIYPARKVLKDAEALGNREVPLEFHIVTDNAAEFSKWMQDIPSRAVKLVFHENLSQPELHRFLSTHSDLHFAMGTSSLDGAKLGVPTIIIDFDYKEFPGHYRYNFLFDTVGFTVGWRIVPGQEFKGFTMEQLVSMVEREEERARLSRTSYEYVRKHHELHQVTSRLIRFSAETKMHLKDAAKYLIRFWR